MEQSIKQDDKLPPLDYRKRHFLVAATSVIGAVGVTATSIPFIASWLPSERAKQAGAPVKFDLGKLQPGMQVTIEWRSKPVFVLRRTEDMLLRLNQSAHLLNLRDPESDIETQQPVYAVNSVRSLREEYFIVIAVCTHLGCIPSFRPDIAPTDLGADWPGGYSCPCHGSRFDFAGRVYQHVPAPTNLVVPPYRYLTDSVIEIGENEEV